MATLFLQFDALSFHNPNYERTFNGRVHFLVEIKIFKIGQNCTRGKYKTKGKHKYWKLLLTGFYENWNFADSNEVSSVKASPLGK